MRIVFGGVGALGSTAAVACRNLDATLRFVDFDRVESKNLRSQAYVKQSVGKHKATALKLQFANFYNVKTEAFAVRLEASNVEALLGPGDLLVDCFDNAASRELISGFARKSGKACLHAAISAGGDYGLVRWDDQFEADAEDEAGQATCEGGEFLPMLSLVASVLARTIQEFATEQRRLNSMISLSGIQRS